MPRTTPPEALRIDVEAYLSGKDAGANRNAQQAAETLAGRAPEFATYAIFSNNAYARPKPFPLPSGWRELRRVDDGKGFACAIYGRGADDNVTEAVIAFRGTDDVQDWAHSLTPFVDQSQAALRTHESVRKINKAPAPPPKISATGHSLGGGLALHLSLTCDAVEAIVFNSSPVVKAEVTSFKANRRTSIWEEGEVLQPVRDLKSGLRDEWEGTELIRVQFDRNASPLKQHKMEPLAYNLVRLAAQSSPAHQKVLDDLPR